MRGSIANWGDRAQRDGLVSRTPAVGPPAVLRVEMWGVAGVGEHVPVVVTLAVERLVDHLARVSVSVVALFRQKCGQFSTHWVSFQVERPRIVSPTGARLDLESGDER
jgi:hypothetical protein